MIEKDRASVWDQDRASPVSTRWVSGTRYVIELILLYFLRILSISDILALGKAIRSAVGAINWPLQVSGYIY
jgi:hypothetical protein